MSEPPGDGGARRGLMATVWVCYVIQSSGWHLIIGAATGEATALAILEEQLPDDAKPAMWEQSNTAGFGERRTHHGDEVYVAKEVILSGYAERTP